jgi:hypothetical protein
MPKHFIFRHILVSFLCGFTELLIFYISSFWVGFEISHYLSFLIASLLGFLLHSFFTFKLNTVGISRFFIFLFQIIVVSNIGFMILRFYIHFFDHLFFCKILQLFSTLGLNIFFSRFITFKQIKS